MDTLTSKYLVRVLSFFVLLMVSYLTYHLWLPSCDRSADVSTPRTAGTAVCNGTEASIIFPEHSSGNKLYKHPLTRDGNTYWSDIVGSQILPGIFQDCNILFPNRSKSRMLPDIFYKVYDPFYTYMKEVLHGDRRPEGSSLAYAEESMVYWNIAHRVPYIHTVCETGFNTGEGTVMWLSAKDSIKVYSFDIGQHSYARKMAAYIHEHFPGRHNITWGDSTKTLPTFSAANHKVKCDLVFIDGGHTYGVALADFNNFANMAYTGSIVILDNYPDTRLNFMTELGLVWEAKRRTGEIIEIFKCSYGRRRKQGFSVGILIK